jgi:riboflavin kinase/FMN adenylyltransferase
VQLIRHARELNAGSRKVCVAIGMFDGVHLGHRQVIRQTILDARQHHGIALVATFDRHPNSVVAPDRNPPLIYSLPQKLRAIEELGADAVLLIEFTKEFSRQPGDTFVRNLAADLPSIYSICVGSSFTFGHKRSGNVALLKALGQKLNFVVHGLAAVSLDGKIVSSTRIRETIRGGDLDAASQMLGRTYAVAGRVIEGDKLGRKLGVPTANLDVTGLLLPPNGVYAVHAKLNGNALPAVANIGFRPTLKNPQPQVRFEVHLLDFQKDIYGVEMEVSFLERIRPEQKFESVDSLRDQILQDIEAARHCVG